MKKHRLITFSKKTELFLVTFSFFQKTCATAQHAVSVPFSSSFYWA